MVSFAIKVVVMQIGSNIIVNFSKFILNRITKSKLLEVVRLRNRSAGCDVSSRRVFYVSPDILLKERIQQRRIEEFIWRGVLECLLVKSFIWQIRYK